MIFPITNGLLQGDLDADGFQILNLNLAGLNLTKSSVGLGNVDNTSDVNKPVSTAMSAALALKQNVIALGTTDQYFRGDLSLGTLGALGLQGGDTTLQSLSSIGLSATGLSEISARRNDYISGPSYAKISAAHYGASYVGSVLGLSAANAGALAFFNSTLAFIYTNNTSPLVFGYNGLRRMRLMTGLNVGGDTDPGIGCIKATGDITGDSIFGTDLTLTGGATLGDDLILSGGGANLAVGGNAVVTGSLAVTSTISTASNFAAGGNLAISGSVVNFAALPTSDPHLAGSLWRSSNDVKISTG